MASRAGFPRKHLSAHALRHTYAGHFMMADGNIYTLQKILGHASIRMTERYSHLSPAVFTGEIHRLDGLVPAAPAEVVPLSPVWRTVSG